MPHAADRALRPGLRVSGDRNDSGEARLISYKSRDVREGMVDEQSYTLPPTMDVRAGNVHVRVFYILELKMYRGRLHYDKRCVNGVDSPGDPLTW